jgi:PAS domain S-box-containing protein
MSDIIRVLTRPAFWIIFSVFALITIPHYAEAVIEPPFVGDILSYLNLSRHGFERILFLVPIVLAGFLFGLRGALLTCFLALAAMLPRAIIISEYYRDALFETGAVFVMGIILAISSGLMRQERERRIQLEITQQEFQTSEEKYRQLFENANDAIWLHDMDGEIVAANDAAIKLIGYSREELLHMNAKELLSKENRKKAREIREKLLKGEYVEQPYEQKVITKQGSETIFKLTTNVVRVAGQPIGFQLIARDVTQEKRMRENIDFYLQHSARSREDERKRVSSTLYDDTIQELVVLSRQIDDLVDLNQIARGANGAYAKMQEQIRSIMNNLSRLSYDLRPPILDHLGLLPAIQSLVTDCETYSKISTNLSIKGEPYRLPENVELVLFRITQEALRNVYRHSSASKADVNMNFDNGKVVVSISDNGKGSDIPKMIGDLARTGKLGLTGIQEQTRLVGGNLVVKSRPGEGTRIIVEVPTSIAGKQI